MPIKYIGRTTSFEGKSLWEILGNLRDFGVGRIVTRNIFERYPEPSYMKIVKVEALPNEDIRKIKVIVERTFRGRKLPKLFELSSASYKSDYKLIPKAEETTYCRFDGEVLPERILPRYMEFPPLLKQLIMNNKRAAGEEMKEEPKLLVKYHKAVFNRARVANEGEKPNVEIISGFGTPASPDLYKGIKL